MEASRFDDVARSLGDGPSRRTLLGLALVGILGALAPGDAEGKRREKRRRTCKRACGPCQRCRRGRCRPGPDGAACGTRQVCSGGACVPAPPACDDGVRNGDESDVDCGGSCPTKCANGKACVGRADCAGALCADGTCRACTQNDDCGADANGPCYCNPQTLGGGLLCTAEVQLDIVDDCASCPPGTICVGNAPSINCFPPCGAP